MKAICLTKTFSSKDDFDRCFRDVNINIQTNSGNVILNKRVLLADEQGRLSHKKGEEITRFVWAKKEFLIDSLDISSAELLFFIYEYKDNTSPLYININSNIIKIQPNSKTQGLYSWRSVNVPVSYLKVGRNEIIFRSDSVAYNSWILGIENANLSDRSAKSNDSGKTWNYELMGFDDSLKGEYVVRLLLVRYPNKGVIVSPVIDITDLGEKGQIKKQAEIARLKLAFTKKEPEGTNIAMEVLLT